MLVFALVQRWNGLPPLTTWSSAKINPYPHDNVSPLLDFGIFKSVEMSR